MPKANCPQETTLWCPHHDSNVCRPVARQAVPPDDPCIWVDTHANTQDLVKATHFMVLAMEAADVQRRSEYIVRAEEVLRKRLPSR